LPLEVLLVAQALKAAMATTAKAIFADLIEISPVCKLKT
jgi:hypothetical protein